MGVRFVMFILEGHMKYESVSCSYVVKTYHSADSVTQEVHSVHITLFHSHLVDFTNLLVLHLPQHNKA